MSTRRKVCVGIRVRVVLDGRVQSNGDGGRWAAGVPQVGVHNSTYTATTPGSEIMRVMVIVVRLLAGCDIPGYAPHLDLTTGRGGTCLLRGRTPG